MNAIQEFRLKVFWHEFDDKQKNEILNSAEFENYDRFLCRTLPIEKVKDLFNNYSEVSFSTLFINALRNVPTLLIKYFINNCYFEFGYDFTFLESRFTIGRELLQLMFINSYDCFQTTLQNGWHIVEDSYDYSDFFQTAISTPNFNFQSAKLLMSKLNAKNGFKRYSLEQLLVEAAKRNKIEFVQLFLGAGANPSFNRQQALRYAEKNDNQKIIKLLKGYF